MATILTDALRVDPALNSLRAWRAQQLLVGFWRDLEREAVWRIADDLAVEYRAAITLREAGCPPGLAYEILR